MTVVTVNAGFGQTHLLPLAADLASRRELAAVMLGGAISGDPLMCSPALRRLQVVGRLKERTRGLPSSLVSACWSAEAVHQAAQMALHLPSGVPGQRTVAAWSLQQYQRRAWTPHALKGSRIFHSRSGFMGPVMAEALKQSQVTILADHTIAHPSVLSSLLDQAPRPALRPVTDPFWKIVLDDLALADHTAVNSDFVKETCRIAGMPADRVTVVYTRPEAWWFDACARWVRPDAKGPRRLLTAGTHERRKGSHLLLGAARSLLRTHPSALWTIAGSWAPDLVQVRRALSALPNIELRPKVRRADLAALMCESDVFVLPTLAEGSARVVTEAMVAGCAVVTTPNAGTPLRAPEGGLLVRPGNEDDLYQAIEILLEDPQRMREAGRHNREQALVELAPGSYVEEMRRLYARLVG